MDVQAGRFSVNTDRLICDKLLEMMETTPFYEVKVTQLVKHAGIRRSTFYAYFDSIYDVLQKIEDEFIDGFLKEEVVQRRVEEDQLIEMFVYMRENMHTFKMLCGPNGDPSFTARLANRSKRISKRIVQSSNSPAPSWQQGFIQEFLMGGRIYGFLWWAEHENEVSIKDIALLFNRVFTAAYDTLFEKPE